MLFSQVMLRDADSALSDFRSAIKLSPYTAHMYFNRGNLYASMELFDQAEADYSKGTTSLLYTSTSTWTSVHKCHKWAVAEEFGWMVMQVLQNWQFSTIFNSSMRFVICWDGSIWHSLILPQWLMKWHRSSSGVMVKFLACRAKGLGFESRFRCYVFKDWLSPASKSRYG